MEWTHTTIQHGPRKRMGLSSDEYVLLDLIYRTQTSPIYGKDGWCEHSYAVLAEAVGIGKGGVFQMVDRLVKRGFIEVDAANPLRKKAVDRFALLAYHDATEDENGVLIVQKVNGKRSESERKRSESERHIKEEKNLNISIKTTTTEEANFFNLKDPDINIADPDAGVKAAQKMAAYFKADGADQWRMMNGPEDEKAIDAICWDWANSERNISLVPFWRRHVGKLANWITSYKNRQHDNDTSTQRNGRVQQRPTDALTLSFDEFQQRFGSLSPSGKPKG